MADSLHTGNTLIDTQHKELIQRIAYVLTACEERKGAEAVKETLEFLGAYVVKHFIDEEKMQQEYNYPGYKDHKKMHEKMTADFTELKNQFDRDGSTLTVITKTNRFLVRYLLQHIKVEDKKLAAFIKAHDNSN
ncbi:MAG: bacteriohemerythrin [Alkaliphilus sp.]